MVDLDGDFARAVFRLWWEDRQPTEDDLRLAREHLDVPGMREYIESLETER